MAIAWKKVVYVGVFLTDESKEMLLNKVAPQHRNVYGGHLTLAFKPTGELQEQLERIVGRRAELTVVGVATDDKGQAVKIEGAGPLCQNKNPHITVSCADGIAPKYSNELMETINGHLATIEPFKLEGVVEVFPKQ